MAKLARCVAPDRSVLLARAILAAPFLIAVLVLGGLTEQIETFHFTDELVYHVPTIQQFARDWPTPDLVAYPAAQTPLYHWLMAGVVEVFGFHLWLLRAFSVVGTYGAVLVLLRLLIRRGLSVATSTGLALLFALSPYVFGAAFLAMTDGLALLLVMCGLYELERYRSERSRRALVLFCVALGLAVLTRQNAAWLGLAGILVVAATTRAWRPTLAIGAGVGLALVPFATLAVSWGGLVPKGSDSTSCGLCRTGGSGASLSLRPGLFTLALLGIYAIAVLGPSLLSTARRRDPSLLERRSALMTLAAMAGALIALAWTTMRRSGERDAGYLWRLSSYLPEFAGSSVLFWPLVLLGAALAVVLIRRACPNHLALAVGVSFLASTVVIRLPYQKYFDPIVLLFVLLAVLPSDLRRRWEWVGAGCLALAFLAYVVALGGGT